MDDRFCYMLLFYVLGFFRETKPTGRTYGYMYPFIGWRPSYLLYMNQLPMRMNYLNQLTHMILETGKCKVCMIDQQVGDSGKIWCHSSLLKAVCWPNSLFLVCMCVLGGVSPFFF